MPAKVWAVAKGSAAPSAPPQRSGQRALLVDWATAGARGNSARAARKAAISSKEASIAVAAADFSAAAAAADFNAAAAAADLNAVAAAEAAAVAAAEGMP